MPELSSWPTQNSGPTGTVDSREAATHIGGLVFPHTSAFKAKSGFRPGPGSIFGNVTASSTPDGFVHVAPFQLFLQNIRGSGQGTYIAALDAIKDINILSTPADPTNPRDDLIISQQNDIFDGDANSDFVVRHVVGTPAPVPSDPAISGSTNVVAHARVRVTAGATTITGSNITDLRTTGHAKSLVGGLHSVALGGLLPVASQAQRDALTGLYSGLAVWRQDLKQIEVTDASAWRVQGLVKISENILGGAAASVTFSSIPAGFSNLQIHIMARGDNAATSVTGHIRFNSDSTAIYDTQQVAGFAATVSAAEVINGTSAQWGDVAAATAAAGAPTVAVINIPWFGNTTFWKSYTSSHALSNGTGTGTMFSKHWTGRWRNTAAITSITLIPAAGNFIAGSSFALYGLP